ncbi:10346_t:CDS:2 [Entrophospora sp. SA101]|nr:10346_t:CDS:2 [Entrophospora sp. SA101]
MKLLRNLYHVTINNKDNVIITKRISKNLLSSTLTTSATTSTTTSNVTKPFRLAIIGSGPAGFYTAYRLLKEKYHHQPLMMIDMYEALPMPFGLVRYGVAPDHQDVKNVQHRFDEVANDSRYQFIGNVKFGHDLTIDDLKQTYDAIVFSYGAGKEKSLGIKNDNDNDNDNSNPIKNVFSARAFVGWYNGLPQYRHLNPDLSRSDTVLVIGHGNVALDVARILLMDIDKLSKTDITEYALEALKKSEIKHVVLVGPKELREMINLPNTRFHIDVELLRSEIKENEQLIAKDRTLKRILQILEKGVTMDTSGEKSWTLKYLRSPLELIFTNNNVNTGAEASNSNYDIRYIKAVKFSVNRLEGPAEKRVAISTKESDVLECGLLLKSVGYKSVPVHGLPFDEKKGIVPNDKGKIIELESNNELPGLYVSGWLKRGPQGVIATTMYDAFETAETIISDIQQNKPMLSGSLSHLDDNSSSSPKPGINAILPILKERGVRVVSYNDWKKIEEKEIEEGRKKDKPREKCGIEEAFGESGGLFITLFNNYIRALLDNSDSRQIFYFLLLNLSYMFVQMVYGFWTNSLGLISDAIHMFFDCLALAVGLLAAIMSKWPENNKFTYGYGRIETLSGFANGIFLVFISIFIMFEAIGRLINPPEMNTDRLLLVSFLGLVVNLVGILAFNHGHAHHGHGHNHAHHGH